jgi:hypothetical protein
MSKPLTECAVIEDGIPIHSLARQVAEAGLDPQSVVNELSRQDLIRDGRLDFVGVCFLENFRETVLVCFPKSSNAVLGWLYDRTQIGLQEKRLLAATISVILKYDREKPSFGGPKLSSEIAPKLRGISRAFHGIWLLHDFATHGLFETRAHRVFRGISGGRIDWGRTIRSQSPFGLRSPVYLEFVLAQSSRSFEGIVASLHSYAISMLIRSIGWIFGIQPSPHVEAIAEGAAAAVERLPPLEIARLLDQQKVHEFEERRILLLEHLVGFYTGDGAESKHQLSTFGCSRFEWIWQRVCAVAFHDEYYDEFKHLMPQARLYSRAGSVIPTQTKQIPDIMFRTDRHPLRAVILDAKYYAADSMPGWDSIGKQLMYAYSIRAALGLRSNAVLNAFVLPGCARDELIREIGMHNEQAGFPDLGAIHCFYLGVPEAFKLYLRPARSESMLLRGRLLDDAAAALIAR